MWPVPSLPSGRCSKAPPVSLWSPFPSVLCSPFPLTAGRQRFVTGGFVGQHSYLVAENMPGREQLHHLGLLVY